MKNSTSYLLLLLLTLSCSKKLTYNDPIPVHDTFKIESKIVNETRVINVWTPPQYKSSSESLPVLYMPDGGIKEDFPHMANTLSKLVENKSIDPIMLVGIENTVRRRDLSGASNVVADEEYCPLTDGAKNFRTFITEELMTEINSKYRTTTEKGIIGESLAGLFVMETFLKHHNLFDFYIAIDPSIWWDDNSLETKSADYLKAFSDKETKMWFAGSSAVDISVHTNNLAKSLKINAPSSVIWKYSDEPGEKHSTIFRATKEKALIWAMEE